MIVTGIDPRDTEWEREHPTYRVYFWSQPGRPAGDALPDVMFHSDEHRLTEARDVQEVLDWAHATATSEQTFTVYVEHRDSDDRLGLILLLGDDPTSGWGQVIQLAVGGDG